MERERDVDISDIKPPMQDLTQEQRYRLCRYSFKDSCRRCEFKQCPYNGK